MFRQLFALLLAASFLLAGSAASVMPEAKKKIAGIRSKIEKAPAGELGQLYLDLAHAYLDDQDLENAFGSYLKALDAAAPLSPPPVSGEEKALYDKALQEYLEPGSQSPQEQAVALIKTYSPYLKEHPDYYRLIFVIAAAEANVSHFSTFFDDFYQAYRRYPDDYFAYKTKAILHVKLLERATSEAAREEQRKLLMENLRLASEKNENDTGLYKIMMVFASDKDKAAVVSACLNKIIGGSMIVPRGNLMFFVQQASSTGQCDLAERFLAKAREWYPYSRTLTAAEEYLRKCTPHE